MLDHSRLSCRIRPIRVRSALSHLSHQLCCHRHHHRYPISLFPIIKPMRQTKSNKIKQICFTFFVKNEVIQPPMPAVAVAAGGDGAALASSFDLFSMSVAVAVDVDVDVVVVEVDEVAVLCSRLLLIRNLLC